MADQLVFNDDLELVGLDTGITNLTGTVGIDYGDTTNTVTGSLSLTAAGALAAQTYTNLSVVRTGTIDGVPQYRLTGSNDLTAIAIDYAGQLPVAANASVSTLAGVGLAGGTGNVASSIVCFAEGTSIRTLRGEIAVERLQVGDRVITASGKRRTIQWLGSRTIDCRRHPEPRAVMPIRIAAHAFAANVPSRDLMVSPGHGICVSVLDEVLMPAGLLVNGSTVTQVGVEQITYWHVELESHDILFSNGLRTESYIDVGNRDFFDGRPGAGDPDPLPEARTLEHYCRPYVTDEAFVRAIRSRLQARARTAGWTLGTTPLANIRLLVDGIATAPKIEGLEARFTVPSDADEIWLVSETTVPAMIGDGVDMRALGLAVRAITVGGRSIGADDPRLCVGFHPVEGDGAFRFRWSTGRSLLPKALWEGLEGDLAVVVDLAGPALPRWIPPQADDREEHRAAA